ncbi:MAG: signal peptidase II [Anaerolineales bacterium]|nr:signal peptidase II [Anaerolineales bacterium]
MNRKRADYLFLFGIAGFIIAVDQWTKWWVRTNLASGETWAPWPWIEPYARFIHWHNTGAAFGMFQGMNTVFMILAIIVSGIIIYYFPQVPRADFYLRLPMAMQLGGALGNLIDRFRDGYVTDFVSVGSFAVFNVADASISVGVAILFAGLLWHDHKEKRQRAGVPEPVVEFSPEAAERADEPVLPEPATEETQEG